jgi:hypothetical protein
MFDVVCRYSPDSGDDPKDPYARLGRRFWGEIDRKDERNHQDHGSETIRAKSSRKRG